MLDLVTPSGKLGGACSAFGQPYINEFTKVIILLYNASVTTSVLQLDLLSCETFLTNNVNVSSRHNLLAAWQFIQRVGCYNCLAL